MLLVASTAYLEKFGLPASPLELTERDGICFAIAGSTQLVPWSFNGEDGEYVVTPKPRVVTNDITALVRFALSGLGLTCLFSSEVQQHIESGELVSVLEPRTASFNRHTINYLSKRHRPVRLRAFIDLAKERKSTER